MPLLSLGFALSVGALGGVGSYTFRYAEGLSYFETDPGACANCHIMQPNLDSWQKSSHHEAAVCVDCHLPEPFFDKYYAKAENGWRHGKLFTTGGFVEPIRVQKTGHEILQGNCVRCHAELTFSMRAAKSDFDETVELGAAQVGHDSNLPCVHCHADVGHGPRAGLGGPPTKEELAP